MSRNEGPVGQIQTDGPGALDTDRTTQAAVAALPHIPALDGLWGVAILVVMLVGGGLSFAVAALSFVTVERWGMSLRNPGGWSRRFAQAMGRIADDTRKD